MTVITSFNINGIRARPHQLEAIKEQLAPDILGLQESKVADEQFPRDMVEALGYQPAYHGQKGHYGVALLSKKPPKRLTKGFPGDTADAQRRAITGVFSLSDGSELTVINGYFPQGESRDHPVKFPYKERFYANLLDYLRREFTPDQHIVVMGDMNVAPLDSDIGIGADNAKRWLRSGKCSFLPEEREWFSALTAWGLQDSFRALHPEIDDRFSWFDYRSRAFEREPKRGLRIDLILVSAPVRERLRAAGIDYGIRALDKPSDHCPVWIEID
ncbi:MULTISPECIES: exodeoxyribonuclease III [Thiorhodovibrio]|uniref:exodeoxyribonuclease III n=1 Tax=Thiorhodovibrio TaxID=61593 RepID=UPI00191347CC|nr:MULTISPECIES: exodeoxyribonuclease III [Thiorhodovibrio]MBK5968672.1 exodeoxyribonuclease III [Thiorhodovibrio winogradskyi]WPL10970.1 Exodeoxyribonuclease III [Thiorhodovibrio litoralis]